MYRARKALIMPLLLLILSTFAFGCGPDAGSGAKVGLLANEETNSTEYLAEKTSDKIVFYLQTGDGRLFVPITREIERGQDPMQSALKQLANTRYLDPGLVSRWPQDLHVKVDIQGKTACVDIGTPGRRAVEAGHVSESAVSQLVYTLTEFDEVEWVQFLAGGSPIQLRVGKYNLGQLLKRPDIINPLGVGPNLTTIYLVVTGSRLLVPVGVPFFGDDSEDLLNLLISSTASPGLSSPLPKTTTIRQVYTKGSTAFVDLHGMIIQDLLDEKFDEELALSSIAATLTELEGIDEVQILIGGRIVGSTGLVDVSRPLAKPRFINLISKP